MVVVPSCAVTTIVIILLPTIKGMAADGVPEGTTTPLTLTVAVASLVVGVTVIDVVALLTDVV